MEIGYSPAWHLLPNCVTMGSLVLQEVGKETLPWIRNATLIPHTPMAAATATSFRFQMAMLEISMST